MNNQIKDDKLKKVVGGWSAKDTARYDDLIFQWNWARARANSALNSAKASGDASAIKNAQDVYDALNNDANMWKLHDLNEAYHKSPEVEVGFGPNMSALDAFWASFDYDYYMNWFKSI